LTSIFTDRIGQEFRFLAENRSAKNLRFGNGLEARGHPAIELELIYSMTKVWLIHWLIVAAIGGYRQLSLDSRGAQKITESQRLANQL
jgi:hypothetical protein